MAQYVCVRLRVGTLKTGSTTTAAASPDLSKSRRAVSHRCTDQYAFNRSRGFPYANNSLEYNEQCRKVCQEQ